MSDLPVLSKDERAYIAKVLKESASPSSERVLHLNEGEIGEFLLEGLAEVANLTIEAQADNLRLSFPLEVQRDEFQHLQLQLGVPRIYETDEKGPTQRPWRVHLEPAVALLDEDGETTRFQVLELSPNGMLVDVGDGPAPERLALRLPLGELRPVPIRARLVRTSMPGVAAYSLQVEQKRHAERIRRFIFQQHRLQHPLQSA